MLNNLFRIQSIAILMLFFCCSQTFGSVVCPANFILKSSEIVANSTIPNVQPIANTWGSIRDMNVARYIHDVATVNGKIYVFGGAQIDTNKTDIYDPSSNTWTLGANYPGGTTAPGIMVAAVGNKIYTFQGINTYEYDTMTNTWTKKADNTISRTRGAAVNIDGKIYVLGGFNGVVKNQIYNPILDAWSNAADIPTIAGSGFTDTQATAAGGKIYLIGGVAMSSLQVYDPCSDTWSAHPNLTDFPPSNQYNSHSTVAVNGEIYVSGGRLTTTGGGMIFHKKYNPLTRIWTTLPDLPSPLLYNRAVAIGSNIYVIGGATSNSTTATKQVFVYNTGLIVSADESISRCNCQPACGEGKYYSVTDNACKPNNEIVADTFCNNNSTCEVGESCNCSDCTNGGLDDKDACGISNGVQMYCSRDTDFRFPLPPAATQTFTDRANFLTTTNSAIFAYDHILSKLGKAAWIRTTSAIYNFPLSDGTPNKIGISIQSLGAKSTDDRYIGLKYRDNDNYMSRGNFSIPGVYFAVSGKENIDFNFTKPIKSFGVDMYESTDPGTEFCNTPNAPCVQSTFTFTAYLNEAQVGTPQTFTPADNQLTFFGFSAPSEFNQVRVRETVGGIDNEQFGRIYYQDRSAGETATPNTTLCSIGACCPAGKKWDCDTNTCILDELVCPAGTTKTPTPGSPVCLLVATPRTTPAGTSFSLTGYAHLIGTCTLASDTTSIPPAQITPSAPSATLSVSPAGFLSVNATTTTTTFMTTIQAATLLTCPASGTPKCTIGTGGVISCGCYTTGVTPPALVVPPSYTCVSNLCAEGQYFCSAENTCKPAGATCGTVTCNNNNVCDTNESCNCADCNDKADHCALDGTTQLICTKDTAPVCYTDKFPYCLSACLDGAKFNTVTGQCDMTVVPATPFPMTCTNRNVTGGNTAIATCQSTEVLTGGGCSNTSGGAYFLGGFPINSSEVWQTYQPTYDPGYWHSLEGPAAGTTLTAAANGYACATGYAATGVTATAVCCSAPAGETTIIRKGSITAGSSLAQCNTGEVRVGGGCRYVSGGAYFRMGRPINKGETISGLTSSEDGFICIGDTGTQIEARVVCRPPHAGETMTIRYATNGIAECLSNEKVTGGGCESVGGMYYYIGAPLRIGEVPPWGGVASTKDGYTCGSGASGTTSTAYAICVDDGTASVASSNLCKVPSMRVLFTRTENVPNAVTLGANTVLQANPTFDLTNNSVPIEDSTLLYDTPNLAVRRHNGYVEFLARKADSVYGYYTGSITLENATVNRVEGGLTTYNYASIGLEAADEGDFATKTNTTTVNFQIAFALQGDSFRVYYTLDTGANSTCTTPTTPPSTTPQLGACCPPGSAWNSIENRCIPTTCGEGKFYCAAQKKCLNGGETCDTTVCVNDGVCGGEESCQCSDCVDGPTQTDPAKKADDKDKCSIIGGKQAICSDDNLTDNKPGACCIPPKKWSSTANGGVGACLECSNTQAPSELKAGLDQPYITCTGNGDLTKTHFRYRITKEGSTLTSDTFISEIFQNNTQVLHPTMTIGSYTVQCFYGTATTVDASTTAIPDTCTKTTVVSNTANGCSRIFPYRGSTLSDEMTSTTAFDASFRCGSRQTMNTSLTNPYMFRVGTTPFAFLQFDSLISELFNGLTIGPVSLQTQNYNFNATTSDVSCAVKVGGGYSTNNSCQLRACSGANCNVPQTFSVIHSGDLTCTSTPTDTYNIGCNPDAPDAVRNACVAWFQEAIANKSIDVPDGTSFKIGFIFTSEPAVQIDCIKYASGQMPGGLNLAGNVICDATLNNGEKYEIYAADINTNTKIESLQTTSKTVEFDNEAPTMTEVKYYTDSSLTTEVQGTSWHNKPVIALAVCSDTPLNEAKACACSPTVDQNPTFTTTPELWSPGIPNNIIGADLMRYTRTISSTLTGSQSVRIIDKAGNKGPTKTLAISLDTVDPAITVTEGGTTTARLITLTANDTGSKIWKATSAPASTSTSTTSANIQGILYRVGPKADVDSLVFDDACGMSLPASSSFATVAETIAGLSGGTAILTQALTTAIPVNTTTQVLTYCVRDNAGNTTRGIYPTVIDACFSASNMSTIPTFATYRGLTSTRLSGTGTPQQKYGYSFSENTTNANCFRGILASNVTTLIANQLTPRTTTTLSNWNADRALIKGTPATPNTNGYYYYNYATLSASNSTLSITTPPTGSGTKTVVVDGGNIRITNNLTYANTNTTGTSSNTPSTLILIARKDNTGKGGNITIDPTVTHIDAILIADGGSLQTTDSSIPGERLTINGRIYSYNTRGGSLKSSGNDIIDATSPQIFSASGVLGPATLLTAQTQDLERLRPMFIDGTNTCSLTVNYQLFTNATLPALLVRPPSYGGGNCGF